MKPVILKVSFALLLVLALCTVASYHIERIMMAKVTVSLPQDGIVRGVPCEATVLPLSSPVSYTHLLRVLVHQGNLPGEVLCLFPVDALPV